MTRVIERYVVMPVVGVALAIMIVWRSSRETSNAIEAFGKSFAGAVEAITAPAYPDGKAILIYPDRSTEIVRGPVDIRIADMAGTAGDCSPEYAPYRDREDYLVHTRRWWQR